MTVPAVEPNVAPPKPKKFFKSRNAVPSEDATLPTSSVAPPDADKAFPSFSKKEEKQTKPLSYSKKTPKVDSDSSSEIPKLKIHIEKSPKNNKSKFFATKASKKDEPVVEEKTHLSPNKRYLVRNRDKVINYSEDRSNSPPALDAGAPPVNPTPVKVSTPKTSPALSSPTTTYVKPGLLSPTNKDGKPPIVLRISKGTSRLLSTDSEEVLTSPNADRNPFADPIVDQPPEMIPRDPEIVSSPPSKQDGIKITIKCYYKDKAKSKSEPNSKSIDSVTDDAEKESSQSTRATRASRRIQHKDTTSNEEVGKGTSPPPGSDNYELYRTLASPESPQKNFANDNLQSNDVPMEDQNIDPVELSLAALNSGEQLENLVTSNDFRNPKLLSPSNNDKDMQSLESNSGRAMRHRANINYNENANSFIDDITSTRFNKNPAKSYSRRTKKKSESQATNNEVMDTTVPDNSIVNVPESLSVPQVDEMSMDETRVASDPVESESSKVKNNKKNTQKSTFDFNDVLAKPDEPSDFNYERNTKSNDKQCKNNDKHVFKSPKRLVSDSSPVSTEGEEKPSVKLVITKKKGSIFKSRSLVNDGPGATGKKRHLYKHKWADDVCIFQILSFVLGKYIQNIQFHGSHLIFIY